MVAEAVDTTALDAWLAEHLFEDNACEGCTSGWTTWSGPHWHFDDDTISSTAYHYSTTGDGMLMVIDAMREQPIEISDEFGKRVRSVGWAPWNITPTAVALAAKAALEAEAA